MTSSAKAECLLAPEHDAADVEATVTVTIETPSGRFEFPCRDGEPVLHAGLAQGVTLPYECATGTCGTCRGRTMSGDVSAGWEQSPALAKLKRDKGDILLCQAKAHSDCLIRVPSKAVARISSDAVPSQCSGVIRSSRQLTRDVIEFTVALAHPMHFEAGQFVLVTAPTVTGARAYSMVNYSPRATEIVLVVKRKPNGGFSDWLFSNLIEGAELELFGPMGRATFGPEDEKNLVIVGGGSGIAGMMAILERATGLGHFGKHRGHVFFGVPTLSDGFYLEELSDYAKRADGALEVTLALSNEDPAADTHPSYPSIRLAKGFVHEVMSKAMAGRYDNTLAFVGGPPPMVDGALRVFMTEGGLPPTSIRYDKFG